MTRPTSADSVRPLALQTTRTLLERAQEGDDTARDMLIQRHVPLLRKWAHGRLPRFARDLLDTDDLVQVTLVRALKRLKEFESRHSGAFLAYLRQILINQIRDEIRRVRRIPAREELDANLVDLGPSPLEEVLGSDTLRRYEEALQRLSTVQREAVVLRVEAGFTYEQMAEALGKPTENAARLLVSRALLQLAREMHEKH